MILCLFVYLPKPPLYGPDRPRPATAPVDLGGFDQPPVPTSWYHDRRPRPDPRVTSICASLKFIFLINLSFRWATYRPLQPYLRLANLLPQRVNVQHSYQCLQAQLSYLNNSIDVAFTLFADCGPSAAI